MSFFTQHCFCVLCIFCEIIDKSENNFCFQSFTLLPFWSSRLHQKMLKFDWWRQSYIPYRRKRHTCKNRYYLTVNTNVSINCCQFNWLLLVLLHQICIKFTSDYWIHQSKSPLYYNFFILLLLLLLLFETSIKAS